LRELYAPTLRVHRARRWCDDTPVNVHYIREIVDAFADAKIIHIIRDGRDVAESFLRLDWARTFPQALSTWYSRVKIGQTLGQAVPPCNYIEIGFEELVTNRREVLERILSFIDEEWEEQVLDLIREDRANRHRRQFGKAENRLFEALA
jgi:Sulfotransferase family